MHGRGPSKVAFVSVDKADVHCIYYVHCFYFVLCFYFVFCFYFVRCFYFVVYSVVRPNNGVAVLFNSII